MKWRNGPTAATEKERDQLIHELKEALVQIKTLTGLMPFALVQKHPRSPTRLATNGVFLATTHRCGFDPRAFARMHPKDSTRMFNKGERFFAPLAPSAEMP